jgi:DNA repair exonuclease SbcCD ATPase subunit
MSSDIAAIKRLRDHVRRNPTMFKDAHTVLVALQKAAVSIAEGERIEAEHDEAIERLGKAIAQANQAVADLQALEASIVPKRSEFQRTLFEIEVEFDARYAERMSELSALDFEVAAKHVELEEVEGKLQAIATHPGGVNEAL